LVSATELRSFTSGFVTGCSEIRLLNNFFNCVFIFYDLIFLNDSFQYGYTTPCQNINYCFSIGLKNPAGADCTVSIQPVSGFDTVTHTMGTRTKYSCSHLLNYSIIAL
jgi:hypothetical protein